jgi:hypothetical protein
METQNDLTTGMDARNDFTSTNSDRESGNRSENRDSHREGYVAKTIEEQTAKIPSDVFLWVAIGAMGVSATLQIMGRRDQGNFVGQWAPTILILGLYNKLVKVAGSDRSDQSGNTQRLH